MHSPYGVPKSWLGCVNVTDDLFVEILRASVIENFIYQLGYMIDMK